MEPKDKTTEDVAKDFVKSIQNMSDKRIELALKNRGIENLQEVLEQAKKETIEESKKENKKEIDNLKRDFFVIFGIFASLVTFVVGEISILKTIDNIYDKIGFCFLFVSFILGFLFGLMFLLDSEIIKYKYQKMGWVFSLFFFIGLAFIIMPFLIIKI
jgi:hypothetical protein